LVSFLLERGVQMRRVNRNLLAYPFAILAVLVVLGFRLGLHAFVGYSSAFLLFLAAVMASAWLGGTGPGLFALLLSVFAGNFFFIEPRWTFGVADSQGLVGMVLFIVEGVVTAVLAGQLHRARDQVLFAQAEAQQLERKVLEISDAEQRRIGHDLHDGLGQHLTGIALMTRQLEQRLTAEQSPHTARAEKIADLAQAAVGWTHDLTRSLSSPTLESSGLPAALVELASNTETLFGIECTFTEKPPIPAVPLEAAVHLYRIAQEATSNAVKHGQARRVTITLRCVEAEILLEVADDGTGMQSSGQSGDGMGLKIMRFRANLIGAAVDVSPRRDQPGTMIRCRFPHLSQASSQ
jgi:signal transduction histidine kinase